MQDFTFLTVKETLNALKTGLISSRELTRAYLDKIDNLEPKIRAFLTLTPELALQKAAHADELRSGSSNPDELPPLLGLPIAVKDVLALADVRCTCGSALLDNFKPPYTATTVQRLLNAGVVILGKTNTDEFAMGSSTENSAYQTTHNPWDLTRVPGGSSGGSAAAIAAHMAPLAMGTDTGGSVRQPASFCGVTGLKPTYGRSSRFGLVAYGSSLDSVGLLGQNAEDLLLPYEIMAGQDNLDATSMDLPVPHFQLPESTSLKGLRIGVPQEYFIEGIQPEVEEAIREALRHMQELGATIRQVSLAYTKYALPVYYLIAPAEASANLARYDGVRFGVTPQISSLSDLFTQTRGQGFGPEVKRRIMLGTYALSAGYYDAYYGQAQKVRTLIKRDFEQVFQNVDVIATPVAPTTAFKIGEHNNDPLSMYLEDVFTLPTNLAGVPGMAFPVGFDQNRLPIGMQLMAAHFNEEILFKVTHAYQLSTAWHQAIPAMLNGMNE
jgi:aspartyl-tRNA(Asn)/glutamyl-tRNA(Gln) amidotransferase subunit A